MKVKLLKLLSIPERHWDMISMDYCRSSFLLSFCLDIFVIVLCFSKMAHFGLLTTLLTSEFVPRCLLILNLCLFQTLIVPKTWSLPA